MGLRPVHQNEINWRDAMVKRIPCMLGYLGSILSWEFYIYIAFFFHLPVSLFEFHHPEEGLRKTETRRYQTNKVILSVIDRLFCVLFI